MRGREKAGRGRGGRYMKKGDRGEERVEGRVRFRVGHMSMIDIRNVGHR